MKRYFDFGKFKFLFLQIQNESQLTQITVVFMIKQVWIFLFLLLLEIIPMLGIDTQKGDFVLASLAFEDQGWIPRIHACDRLGKNLSPQLKWTNPPSYTKSFALICHDSDARGGKFSHWIIYNIPATANHFDEGIERLEKLPDGAMQGINSFRRLGYDGPCSSSGPPHHYLFTLYALDRVLDLDIGTTYDTLRKVMTGHILEKAQLTGLFQGEDVKIMEVPNPSMKRSWE